jgi:hypothetical protein
MRIRLSALKFSGVFLLLCGCDLPPRQSDAPAPTPRRSRPRLANRDAVTRCLPADVRLEESLRGWEPDSDATVEDALIKVGAHVAPDGKLRSSDGKEIYFEHVGSGGVWRLPPTPEECAAQARERRELEARYTVITIYIITC